MSDTEFEAWMANNQRIHRKMMGSEHDHVWGPMRRGWLGSSAVRDCLVDGCSIVNALDDEDDFDEEMGYVGNNNEWDRSTRAVLLVELIQALPEDCTDADVIALFHAGDRDVFDFMDEFPGAGEFARFRTHPDGRQGNTYGWWHMRLRQVRNADNDLFERINA